MEAFKYTVNNTTEYFVPSARICFNRDGINLNVFDADKSRASEEMTKVKLPEILVERLINYNHKLK
jgi:hypothetical protein